MIFSLSIPFSANFPWDFTHLSVSSITRNSFASSPEELTSSILKLEIQSKSNVYCWLNRKGFAVQSNTSNIPKHRISLRILPKISVTISRHLLPHSMAKSQVSNMLSPCNARLKSLQTFAKFSACFSVFSFSPVCCKFSFSRRLLLCGHRQVDLGRVEMGAQCHAHFAARACLHFSRRFDVFSLPHRGA